MKNLKILVLILTLAFFSCKENQQRQTEETMPETELQEDLDMQQPDRAHTSENSLDWAGTYSGVFPCADCPGIEMSLKLKNDQTYALEMNYLERDTDFNSNGKFDWSENGQIITLLPDDGDQSNMRFFVGENVLFQVDENGQRMNREQEVNYTLVKEMQ